MPQNYTIYIRILGIKSGPQIDQYNLCFVIKQISLTNISRYQLDGIVFTREECNYQD